MFGYFRVIVEPRSGYESTISMFFVSVI